MHTVPNYHSLHLMGDYHQNLAQLTQNLKELPGNSSIIILGDYDAHQAQDLVDLSEIAAEHKVVMYLMRGNHDCPKCWQDRDLAVLLETEWFKLLEDVDMIEHQGKKLATVSGAVSVDRTCIRFDEGNCWPRIEGVPKDSVERVRDLGAVDILLTHTGIIEGYTVKNEFTKSYASTDETLFEDIKAERNLIQKLQIVSGCTKHYFGHFHKSWKGEQFGVKIRCLNICEIHEFV